MEIYKEFAKVYDTLMKDVPYNKWIKYIEEIWKSYNFKPKTILELGCGTGNITYRLKQKGYDIIGLDISPEMLMVARKKADDNNKNILFLEQDIRNFKLHKKVDACICIYDALNYITDENDILKTFKTVNKYLNDTGIFIFDLNTCYKFKKILGNKNFICTDEKVSYIWENYYDNKKRINEYYITFFILDEKTKMYRRYEECHYQKSYNIEKIINLINKSGLKFLKIYDALTFNKENEKSERIIFITKKSIKMY